MDNDFNKKFHELMDKYAEKFGDWLPMYMLPSDDENNILEILQHCIETGKPYELSEETQELLSNGVIF